MATLTHDHDHLHLRLTGREKLAGLHGDIRVPLAAVRDVRVMADPLAAVHGMRAPGLAIPGRTKIGTWRGWGRRMFVVARRGIPAVRVRLEGVGYTELLVSVPDADAVCAQLRAVTEPGGGAARTVEVTIPAQGVELAGTLLLPPGPGPHPAALLLPGSGEVDRDGDHRRMPLGVSLDLARMLAGRGIASLRYDKRGVGASGGSWLAAGLTDNEADARAALAWLRARPEVAGDDVALIGHSEGALLAATAAADADPAPAGVVLLAPAAKTGEATLAWQTRQVADALPRFTRLLLRLLRIDVVAKQQQNVTKVRATTTDVARIGGRRVNARWQRELLDADPRPAYAALRCPVLAITGAKDLQVDPADLDEIAALTGAEIVRVPDLTHLLRRDPEAPSLSAYKRLSRQPIDPELLRTIGDWVVAHCNEEAGATRA